MMNGMTRRKIAITIPEELLAHVHDAVARGDAKSVSSYISDAVARRNGKRPLELYLDLLDAEYGEPSPEANAWAERELKRVGALPPKRGSRSTRAR